MSPDNNRDKKALESWFDDFSATLKAGDPEQLTSLHTDDAIKMPPREPAVIGREAILEWETNACNARAVGSLDQKWSDYSRCI